MISRQSGASKSGPTNEPASQGGKGVAVGSQPFIPRDRNKNNIPNSRVLLDMFSSYARPSNIYIATKIGN
jgi:hypothetical protein